MGGELAPLSRCLDDLEPLIERRRVVLIGEVHGTNEFPALLTAIVDRALTKQIAVVVGLELPMSEQPARGTLGTFWYRAPEYCDGRSSVAMARLVTELAAKRGTGGDLPLHVAAMDGPWVAPGSPVPLELLGLLEQPRDQLMATNLLDVMAGVPAPFTVVLAGSMHTSLAGPHTMGSYVRRWHPETVALLGQPSGGEAWVLSADGEAGSRPLPVVDVPTGAVWATEPGPDGHHGTLHLGPVTPSPPFGPPQDHPRR